MVKVCHYNTLKPSIPVGDNRGELLLSSARRASSAGPEMGAGVDELSCPAGEPSPPPLVGEEPGGLFKRALHAHACKPKAVESTLTPGLSAELIESAETDESIVALGLKMLAPSALLRRRRARVSMRATLDTTIITCAEEGQS